MTVAIIKPNSANLASITNALDRLNCAWVLTDDTDQINSSDKVIFPGQGEAQGTMEYLKSKKLDKVIQNLKQPFLGICLGMQLLANFSEEGNCQCLGIIPRKVKKFPQFQDFKVPQIGWNKLQKTNSKLFKGIKDSDLWVYFIHSYYLPYISNITTSVANHSLEFSASIEYNNFYGTQFHPEKSGQIGQQILENFLAI